MHSILIIGCGSIGERHLRCLQGTGRARVTGCDTSPELLATIAQTYQVPTVLNWEEALASKTFDACVICTPAQLHVPMAAFALRTGVHVLIEKPLSQSLAGVDDLIRIRDQTKREAIVAYVLHGYPILGEARDFIRRGEIGAPKHVTITIGHYFPAGRPAHAVHYSKTYYRDRSMGGGAIQDALTHSANWIESVVGPTESVLCDCAHQVLEGVTVEDTVNLSARNGNVLVNYTLNQFQPPGESTLQFNSATASLKIEVHERRWGVFRLGDKAWTWHTVPPMERDTPYEIQAHRFLDLLESKPSALCTLEAAAQTLRFNLAALRSAESDARVRCADLRG